MNNEADTARLYLRSSTSLTHQRMDALGARVANVSGSDGYAIFLRTMARVMDQFAVPLDRSSELAGLAPRSQRLIAALAADLHELGAEPAMSPPPLGDHGDDFAWGVGYALEGSALGAAVLLEQARSGSPGLPVGYFSALVDERPGRWSTFSAALNSVGVGPEVETATDGALAVFGLVEASFLELSASEAVGSGR